MREMARDSCSEIFSVAVPDFIELLRSKSLVEFGLVSDNGHKVWLAVNGPHFLEVDRDAENITEHMACVRG